MKRLFTILMMCISLCFPAACAQEMELSDFEDLLPIVVFMYHGEDHPEMDRLLLIIVDKESGSAMKATLHKDLFPISEIDAANSESLDTMIDLVAEKLQLPLDKYVAVETSALEALAPGEGKEKSVWEFVQFGFSVIGSVESNLTIFETVDTFRRAFATKENGLEIILPPDIDLDDPLPDEIDWDGIRTELFDAIQKTMSGL